MTRQHFIEQHLACSDNICSWLAYQETWLSIIENMEVGPGILEKNNFFMLIVCWGVALCQTLHTELIVLLSDYWLWLNLYIGLQLSLKHLNAFMMLAGGAWFASSTGVTHAQTPTTVPILPLLPICHPQLTPGTYDAAVHFLNTATILRFHNHPA